MSDELHYASATRLAALIRSREASSVEVVDDCLARIEAVNPRLNAVVRLADDARERAAEADADLARGVLRGPLHGVPFTAKDSLDTAGLVTTAGTVGWRGRVPGRDATVVARLKAAGAILLGKTNTPEFTWSDETDNDVYGRTSNPYDLDRTPGGSSGGAAAIVAAGGSAFDIGSDTGDSIRQPAHVCGIAGLKPTSGRVPRTGHWPGYGGLFESFTQLGPMARRVEDLALLLPVIAGPDGEDPHVVAVPLADPAAVEVSALRVVTFGDNGIRTPTPETLAAVSAAAEALGATGARVEERVPPALRDAWESWDGLIRADGFAWLWRLISAAGTPGRGSYEKRDWVVPKPALSGDDLTALIERADDVRARLLTWMQDVDLIVCPAMPQPAIRHGESTAAWFGDTYSDIHNLTGWPAAVVRGGTAPGSLPIGVQVVAPPWREDLAIAGALVIEDASGGWQPPPI
ncbi:MAG TPA: amidase [Candidatus Sulfomarinibacteraceae bacterium]|nr:amidase [Candidatus Sulfomarinibacteraceae bacterium]